MPYVFSCRACYHSIYVNRLPDINTNYNCDNCNAHNWIDRPLQQGLEEIDIETFQTKTGMKGIECPNCNIPQNINAIFCADCGTEINPKVFVKVAHCDKCDDNFPIEKKFCEKDGNKLKIIEVEEGSEFQVSDIKSEELDEEIVETVSTDKVQEEQTELGFGWGIFWIVACILQGIVLLFYSIYGLNEYLINPGYAIVIFAISCLAFASGYLVFQRKISGLYLTYFIVIVNYGIGGLEYLVDFLNNGEIGSGLKAVALMLFGGFWWFYFNKRKEMFS